MYVARSLPPKSDSPLERIYDYRAFHYDTDVVLPTEATTTITLALTCLWRQEHGKFETKSRSTAKPHLHADTSRTLRNARGCSNRFVHLMASTSRYYYGEYDDFHHSCLTKVVDNKSAGLADLPSSPFLDISRFQLYSKIHHHRENTNTKAFCLLACQPTWP